MHIGNGENKIRGATEEKERWSERGLDYFGPDYTGGCPACMVWRKLEQYGIQGPTCCQQAEPGHIKQSEETTESFAGPGCRQGALVLMHFVQ